MSTVRIILYIHNNTIIIDVLDPPEVNVLATRTRLIVNGSTTLNCTVTSNNPSNFTLVWTLTTTSGSTTITSTNQTLVLSSVGEDEFGTYTCNVTNSAGLSGTADITIEIGGIYTLTLNVLCNFISSFEYMQTVQCFLYC